MKVSAQFSMWASIVFALAAFGVVSWWIAKCQDANPLD
jgi:hypothetical protein